MKSSVFPVARDLLNVKNRLGDYLEELTGIEGAGSDPDQNLQALALDSLEFETLLAELEGWLGRPLDSAQIARCATVRELIELLENGADVPPLATDASEIRTVEAPSSVPLHAYERHVNSFLGRRLRLLRFDQRFTRAEGTKLYDDSGREYLDFIAAYGALPFGHNPPEIWTALERMRARLEPNFAQPSALEAAGELAERLIGMAPGELEYVTFTNSGTEAVEAAIKLCRAKTSRLGILSTRGSFHGKTLGSLSATGNSAYQLGFGAPVEHFHSIRYGDILALEQALNERQGYFAAFLVEPIQGEGGIVEPPLGYLKMASVLCQDRGVLLVVDEIQTGLGRTGSMFACEEDGVEPDVLLLAKALGGGLVPIGACLATKAVYTEKFALKHSSTFAGNALACRAALATLDLLERDNRALLEHVARNGDFLRTGLESIQKKYPAVIQEVRGRGYMLGLQLRSQRDAWGHSLLGVAAEQGLVAALFSSYLLNIEGVRLAPTLNGKDVVRIEPPLTASKEECSKVLSAIERTAQTFAENNSDRIIRALVGERESLEQQQATPSTGSGKAVRRQASRFAFIVHPLSSTELRHFDDSGSTLGDQEWERFSGIVGDLFEPFVLSTQSVRSLVGHEAIGDFIVIPRTAAELLSMPEQQATAEVRGAIDLARSRGAELVGLGAYTSIVTRGGQRASGCGIGVTSGNSYTVVSGCAAVCEALRKLGRTFEGTTAAVIGAGGSVGGGSALLLAEEVDRLCLVGNPQRSDNITRERLSSVARAICTHLVAEAGTKKRYRAGSLAARIVQLAPSPSVATSEWDQCLATLEAEGLLLITRFAESVLPFADIVIAATSAPGSIVKPAELRQNALVCDLSRPTNLPVSIRDLRPDVLVIDGGLIRPPSSVSFPEFGLEPDVVYACMAEAMLLALEGHREDFSLGYEIDRDSVACLAVLAEKHGFSLAPLRSFGELITEADWQRLTRRHGGTELVNGTDSLNTHSYRH